jgi:hypothetical protein
VTITIPALLIEEMLTAWDIFGSTVEGIKRAAAIPV